LRSKSCRWGYDEGSVFYYRASANFIFVFRKDNKKYFLRFIENGQKGLKEIEAEIHILQYLKTHNIKAAQPIQSLNGKFIEMVETEIGTFTAVVFEALEGKQYEDDELKEEQFFKWGRTLGKLHQTFKEMPKEYFNHRLSWDEQLEFVKSIIQTEDIAIMKEWEKVYEWAENLPVSNENFGIIHYDFELDNLAFGDEEIGMFDFDDCASYWFAADIAFALRDLNDFENPPFDYFLEGYTSETPIDKRLLPELPGFLRMHKLIMFAKLLRAVDIPDSSEYPDWLLGLRAKLMAYVNRYRTEMEKDWFPK
jgi:Ser/Thr protein kinase RdoA (MazF antagonist)